MAAKIALVFLVALVLFQLFSIQTDATIIRRDAPVAEKNTLEDALNNVQQSIKDIAAKVENSELYQNASKVLADFGEKVRLEGSKLVEKIKTSSDAPASH